MERRSFIKGAGAAAVGGAAASTLATPPWPSNGSRW